MQPQQPKVDGLLLVDKKTGITSHDVVEKFRRRSKIKKVGHTYKYYVTAFGKEVVATALKLRQLVILPQLAFGPAL